MLLGQDLGGRHERHLTTALDGLQRRERGDHRLARADVALQQPLHRRHALEIVRDLPHHARLRAGQLERQAREQRGRERARPCQHRGVARCARLAVRLHRQLLGEQFVELEPCPRGMRARVERPARDRGEPRRRVMEELDGIAELPLPPAPHEVLGQRFRRAAGVGRDGPVDDPAQRVLRKPGRRRVHGRQPVGKRRAVVDDAKLRVHDLRSVVALAHLAVDAHAMAGLQRLLLARIEGEEAQRELRGPAPAPVIVARRGHDAADQLAARTVLDVGRSDDALGLHRVADLDLAQRNELRVVLVAQRQVQHEVLLARDAELREPLGETGAGRGALGGLGGRAPGTLRRHGRRV